MVKIHNLEGYWLSALRNHVDFEDKLTERFVLSGQHRITEGTVT